MSYELSIKTYVDYRDCNCSHKMVCGKKSIADLIDIFNSFEYFRETSLSNYGLFMKWYEKKKPILITCKKCKREWKLVYICGIKFILEQFRIYKDGRTKRYKTSRFGRHKVSTVCAIVSKGWKYSFSPKDEDY